MHNRVGPGAEPAELGALDLAVIAPVTAVIVALGVYPQLVLERTEETTVAKVAPAAAVADGAEPQAAEPEPAQELPGGSDQPARAARTVTPEELERLQGGGSP